MHPGVNSLKLRGTVAVIDCQLPVGRSCHGVVEERIPGLLVMHVGCALRLFTDNTAAHQLLLVQLLRNLDAQFRNRGLLFIVHKICRRLKLLGRFESMIACIANAALMVLAL